MAIKVKEVLEIASAKGCTLVAGHGGLNRVVRYVDSIETPDMKSWMRPNVIYITTGYVYSNEKDDIIQLIKSLHEAKAAAIAIKPRFMECFPPEAMKLADELEFPVILIPKDLPFVELNYPVMEAIVKSQNSLMDTLNSQIMEYNKRMMNKNLFIDLLAGNISYTEEIEHRVTMQKWQKPPYQAVLVDGFGEQLRKLPEEKKQGEIERLERIIRDSFLEKGHVTVIMPNSESFLCIIAKMDGVGKEYFETVQKHIDARSGVDTLIGVSGTGMSYQKFSDIYQQAQDAVEIAKMNIKGQRVVCIEEAKFWQLMKEISQQPICREYVNLKLDKLIDYDHKNDSRLLETLESLVNNLGARNTTAASLYLHRNTLIYRIKKIESLTGYDLSDPNSIIELSLALRLKRFM